MNQIIKYDIIEEMKINHFKKVINNYIKKGWQPLGGINFDSGFYYQVMILYKNTKIEKDSIGFT